jgi:hypothetical protein
MDGGRLQVGGFPVTTLLFSGAAPAEISRSITASYEG